MFQRGKIKELKTSLHNIVQLTKCKSSTFHRSPFKILSENDLKHFESLIGHERCITSRDQLDSYNIDWLKKYKGMSQLVLLPKTTQELSSILKYCNENKIAVCLQGGNTGLVGGGVPVFDEVIVSAKLMNKIIKIDQEANILSCQSGCVLQTLDEQLSKFDLMMPLDLGSKGNCMIGGNIATNAGGLRMLRYGSLKGRVLGLEVVLANGDVISSMKNSMRKDNTGYDLKQLFIGSEGTLGFITEASVWVVQKPKSVNAVLIACKKREFQNVIEVFQLAKKELNEILSAFEFMDRESLKCVEENLKLDNPFTRKEIEETEFYCLVETQGSNADHDMQKIEKFYNLLSENKLCRNAILSESGNQIKQIWALRENLALGLNKDGYTFKYDISLPLGPMYEIVSLLREKLGRDKSLKYRRCVGYGHIGDGNLHLNITCSEYDPEVHSILEPFIYEWTSNLNGSISAEHGLGINKAKFIHYSKPESSVVVMRQFKRLFDPNCIMNPYKVLV